MVPSTSCGGSFPDVPATGMLWTDAARFVNRLNVSHGYPAAYNLSASTRFDLWPESNNGFDPNQFRNRLARFVLTSADEWHKAAYYDPSKMVARGGIGSTQPGSDARPIRVG